MIKLFGHPMSTCTRKVLCTLHETNTPYEFVLVDFAKGEHKVEPHLSRQPFGQVPALNDDGFALFESRAMARYIDGQAGGNLTPKDPKQRALMEQWISVEVSDFTPNVMKFIFNDVFKVAQPAASLETATAGLATACGVMNEALAGRTYFLGDQFTLADVTFAPYVDYGVMTSAKETLGKYPHLMAWQARVAERPSWRKAIGKA